MLFEVKCMTCGKDQLILDESENGQQVFICKNPECPDFNCFFEFQDAQFELNQGYTGELEFENEEGVWYEVYQNGKIISCNKIR